MAWLLRGLAAAAGVWVVYLTRVKGRVPMAAGWSDQGVAGGGRATNDATRADCARSIDRSLSQQPLPPSPVISGWGHTRVNQSRGNEVRLNEIGGGEREEGAEGRASERISTDANAVYDSRLSPLLLHPTRTQGILVPCVWMRTGGVAAAAGVAEGGRPRVPAGWGWDMACVGSNRHGFSLCVVSSRCSDGAPKKARPIPLLDRAFCPF